MSNNRLLFSCVCAALLSPGLAQANALAVSSGTLVVNTSTNIFLPVTATGDACLTATAGGVSAPATNYVGNFGAAAGCRNQFFVRSARQPSIFYTYYDLKTYYGYEGNTPLAKFPAPVFGSASLSLTTGAVSNDTTATANGSFGSSQTPFGPVTFRSASLQSDAQVTTRGTGPAGIATGYTYDPWIFTPLSDTSLTLQLLLQSVHLSASGDPGQDSSAIVDITGAFGEGSVPGSGVLATFSLPTFIGATGNQTVDIASLTIFDNSTSPFMLSGGSTYWLTAAIETGAEAGAPEPTTFVLVGGTLVMLGIQIRRTGSGRRMGSATDSRAQARRIP